jgi:hypothetical protein
MFKNTKILNKEKYWQKHISKYEQSGLSQKEYCKQNNLVYDTFRGWRKRLSKISTDDLVQVPSIITETAIVPNESLEIIINDILKIKIPDNFNPATLNELLKMLGQ